MFQSKLKNLIVVAALTLPFVSYAAGNKAAKNSQRYENVESLMDNIQKRDRQMVTVPGEVEYKINDRAFVLESGGVINDEIVVLLNNDLLNAKSIKIDDDEEFVVTGIVRTVAVNNIESDLGWAPDNDLQTKLRNVEAYIIATDIRKK